MGAPSAEAVLSALGGPNAPRGPARIRYVQVGALAGERISLGGAMLRSSGVEILGSGIGSSSPEGIRTGIQAFLEAFVAGRFRISTEVRSAAELTHWGGLRGGARRLVFKVR